MVGALRHLDVHGLRVLGAAKQPDAGAGVARVSAQQLQQRGAQDAVAAFAALAAGYSNAHAIRGAVDIPDPQCAGLGDAQTAGVDGLQQHAPHGVATGGKQVGNLLACEYFGLLGRHFGKRDVKLRAFMSQHGMKQKLRSAGRLVHAAVGQPLIFDHVQQIALHILRAVRGGVATVILGHAVDGADIRFLGASRKAALHHGILHALT